MQELRVRVRVGWSPLPDDGHQSIFCGTVLCGGQRDEARVAQLLALLPGHQTDLSDCLN